MQITICKFNLSLANLNARLKPYNLSVTKINDTTLDCNITNNTQIAIVGARLYESFLDYHRYSGEIWQSSDFLNKLNFE